MVAPENGVDVLKCAESQGRVQQQPLALKIQLLTQGGQI